MMHLSKKFYLSEIKHAKAIKVILQWEKEKRNISELICTAIEHLDEEQEQQRLGSKIDHYQEQETELDIAPRIHEPITEEYLKKLSPKDVGRLHKMIYWNKKILDDYVASLEGIEGMTRKYGDGVQ